jgi:cytochrome b561
MLMSKTIKCWLVANIEGLSGVFFFFMLFTAFNEKNTELKDALKLETIHWVIFGIVSALGLLTMTFISIYFIVLLIIH